MVKKRAGHTITTSVLLCVSVLAACSGATTSCVGHDGDDGLHADLVVVAANIITVDGANPRAQALAASNGKFVAVGVEAEVRALIGPDTRVIDAVGRTITPGFIDAHMHPSPTYPVTSLLGRVDLSPVSVGSIDDLIAALQEKARITPEGQWVIGTRYQDTKLGRHPTRHDLDRASTQHPIRIGHSSGHVSAVNSYALEMAGITRQTPDPAGGGFERDANGEPTGVVWENAIRLVNRAGPPLPEPTREEELEGLRRTYESFLSKGITSIVDAGGSSTSFRRYQDAVAGGQSVRVTIMFRDRYLADLKKLNLRTGFGDDHLRLGAIKMIHGNSLSGRTCWLYEPYDIINPKTGKKDYYGIPPARSQEQLDELIFEIHEAGFQVAVHANGDREIDMVLDAIEKAVARLPKPDHRHRIEHASVVNPGILERAKKLGVVLALHSYVWEHGDKMEAYGEARWGMMHANRSALDLGIPVAGNSDYGVSAADPLLRIQSMVTRTSAEGKVYGAEQRLSAEEAIAVWTLGSAYSTFDEDVKGSIEVGKLADFVILSDDPTAVPADRIKDIAVEMTFIDGLLMYERR